MDKPDLKRIVYNAAYEYCNGEDRCKDCGCWAFTGRHEDDCHYGKIIALVALLDIKETGQVDLRDALPESKEEILAKADWIAEHYTYVISTTDNGDGFGKSEGDCVEMPIIVVEGTDEDDCVENLKRAASIIIAAMLKNGDTPPAPGSQPEDSSVNSGDLPKVTDFPPMPKCKPPKPEGGHYVDRLTANANDFDSIVSDMIKELATIQTCTEGHKFVANSHEYPCPLCLLGEVREHLS